MADVPAPSPPRAAPTMPMLPDELTSRRLPFELVAAAEARTWPLQGHITGIWPNISAVSAHVDSRKYSAGRRSPCLQAIVLLPARFDLHTDRKARPSLAVTLRDTNRVAWMAVCGQMASAAAPGQLKKMTDR
jgi:hypothetical protein